MALDTAKATAILNRLTQRFDEAAQPIDVFYPTVCNIVPSSGDTEDYGALGDAPGVREWLGDRKWNEMRAATYAIKNKEWESSLLIPKNTLNDDRIGLFPDLLANLGAEAAGHPDELLIDLIVNGEATVGWDGQFFFDTDHLWGDSGSQSNDLAVSGTPGSITAAQIKVAYNTARVAMIKFKNDRGKFLNRSTVRRQRNLMFFIPPSMEQASREALETRIQGLASGFGGNENVVLDQPQIVVSPLLTSDAKAYLLNLGAPLRPFIFQAREPLERQTKGLDDLETKDVKFMTRARYNVGYGIWSNAVVLTFS